MAMALPFQDSFNRADNSVVGNGWTEQDDAYFSIVSNRLRSMPDGANTRYLRQEADLAPTSFCYVEAKVWVPVSGAGGFPQGRPAVSARGVTNPTSVTDIIYWGDPEGWRVRLIHDDTVRGFANLDVAPTSEATAVRIGHSAENLATKTRYTGYLNGVAIGSIESSTRPPGYLTFYAGPYAFESFADYVWADTVVGPPPPPLVGWQVGSIRMGTFT